MAETATIAPARCQTAPGASPAGTCLRTSASSSAGSWAPSAIQAKRRPRSATAATGTRSAQRSHAAEGRNRSPIARRATTAKTPSTAEAQAATMVSARVTADTVAIQNSIPTTNQHAASTNAPIILRPGGATPDGDASTATPRPATPRPATPRPATTVRATARGRKAVAGRGSQPTVLTESVQRDLGK
ncbi:hypothetical protein ACRAWC_13575 [Leifsonia sp. L25]|uniref:hypothetical protein n=1 Tax=Actinomycetes TaxID=1760 RepID=UPI003D69EEE4